MMRMTITPAVLTCVLALSAPAHADPTLTSRINWIFDGAVQSVSRLGDTVYVGGTFSAVAPSANALPPVFGVALSTGAAVPFPFPATDGDVLALEPDGAGGWYAGGTFTTIGGGGPRYLAHVLSDGRVDPGFAPQLTDPVRTIALAAGRIYFSFGVRIAVVSAADGSRQPDLTPPGTEERFIVQRIVTAGADVYVAGIAFYGGRIPPPIPTLVAYDTATSQQRWASAISARTPSVVVAGDWVIVGAEDGVRRFSRSTGTADAAWRIDLLSIPGSVVALSGTTLYVGGAFTTIAGQPRSNVAAFDLGSGALLPWNPALAAPVTQLVATPAAVVASTRRFTASGHAQHQLVRIEPDGTMSPWADDLLPARTYVLRDAGAGVIAIASGITGSGRVARRGLAAFDATTGQLLPWARDVEDVRFLAASGGRVYIDTGAEGRILDAVTGADLGPLAEGRPVLADAEWLYVIAPGQGPPWSLRRLPLPGGPLDPVWQFPLIEQLTDAAAGGRAVYLVQYTELVAVDRETGGSLWTKSAGGPLAVNGDTLFARDQALDALTGSSIGTVPFGLAATVADGRLIVLTEGLAAYRVDGSPLTWATGLARALESAASVRPQSTAAVTGDLVVAGGLFGRRLPTALQGLAAFALDGTRMPSALRGELSGDVVTLTWDAPASPPAGGYVVEAGTTPGQPSAALAVGHSTAFQTVMPPGAFFTRVRTAGALGGVEEASNEIRVSVCTTPPPQPRNLVAAFDAGGGVRLAWTAPTGRVSSYRLTVGFTPGSAEFGLTLPASETAFATVAPPGTYYVRVAATNICGTGAPSLELQLTVGASMPLPAAPTGIQITQPPDGRGLVTWTPPPGPVTGYVLEAFGFDGILPLAVVVLGPTPALFVPMSTGPILGLRVQVRAINAAGTGPPSAQECAFTCL